MGEEYINNEEHKQLARKMADEAVVLLKNENEILPFDENTVKNVAVVGPLSDVSVSYTHLDVYKRQVSEHCRRRPTVTVPK